MVEQQLKFQNEKLEMMMDSSDKRFNRLYVYLTVIFLTMLAGFIPLIIKSL